MRQKTPWERQQVVYYGKSLEQKDKPNTIVVEAVGMKQIFFTTEYTHLVVDVVVCSRRLIHCRCHCNT